MPAAGARRTCATPSLTMWPPAGFPWPPRTMAMRMCTAPGGQEGTSGRSRSQRPSMPCSGLQFLVPLPARLSTTTSSCCRSDPQAPVSFALDVQQEGTRRHPHPVALGTAQWHRCGLGRELAWAWWLPGLVFLCKCRGTERVSASGRTERTPGAASPGRRPSNLRHEELHG